MIGKADVRREMRERRRRVSPAARAAAGRAVAEAVLARADVRDVIARCGTVCVYLAFSAEIDLSLLIARLHALGCRLVAPRWTGRAYDLADLAGAVGGDGLRADALSVGPMGIREPAASALFVAPGEVGLWLVPGLAFTAAGDRLGYGGGWYDRFLSAASPDAVTLGVAYGFQVVAALPTEPHDRRLTGVVSA